MKKAHLYYLKTAVNIAINLKNIADVPAQIALLRCYRPPIYRLIRDIAGDARFYVVTENTPFWHRYALASVHDFIKSITLDEWKTPELLIVRKEDFLNSWYFKHVVPMTAAQEEEIELELQAAGWSQAEQQPPIAYPQGIHPETKFCRGNVTDCTNGNNSEGMFCNWPLEIGNYVSDVRRDNMMKGTPGMGNNPGATGTHRCAEAIFMRTIDPTLRQLAKMIGRSGGTATTEVPGKFQYASRSDISGVSVGNDLNCLLPIELAMLGNRSTEDIFYRKYSQKRLQVFSSSSSSTEKSCKKKGAIVMCVDTSGSMSGKSEMMAKSLALAIAIIAQRENRPLCVINYSDDLSFFILHNFQKQRRKFLKFLGHSYSGGNNENLLFNFLFKKLPYHPQYNKFQRHFKNADLLVVSDFFWSDLHNEIVKTISNASAKGLKIYTLKVGESRGLIDGNNNVYECSYGSDRFLQMSDYRFQYNGRKVIEIKSHRKKNHNGTKNETSGRNRVRARKLRARNDYRTTCANDK